MNLFGTSSFIEVYDKALTEKECQIIVESFEKSEYQLGYTGQGYRPEDKKCMQMVYSFSDINPVSNILRPSLIRCMERYYKKYIALNDLSLFNIYDNFNIQRYEGEDDGFKRWHCEHGPEDDACKRILAWMVYLNDAKSGTEFKYYPTINAKRGRCVIWPAGFTHTHKGVIPNKGLKYIATGWVSFN